MTDLLQNAQAKFPYLQGKPLSLVQTLNKQLYQQFRMAVPDATMQDRYRHHQQHQGEQRPYRQWLEMTGMPELFRGYTFDQFGPEAEKVYTPEQLEILNQVRGYLGIQ